jgi:hypothetical protein
MVVFTDEIEDFPLPADRAAGAHRTYQISTLMLLIALIAVCLGVMHEVPGLGIALFLVMIPALVRTTTGAARRRAEGRPMSWQERAIVFAASMGIVVLTGLAALITFVAICFPTGMFMIGSGSQAGFVVAIALGIVGAIVVCFLVGRALWPQKDA